MISTELTGSYGSKEVLKLVRFVHDDVGENLGCRLMQRRVNELYGVHVPRDVVSSFCYMWSVTLFPPM